MIKNSLTQSIVAILTLLSATGLLHAGSIAIPNSSFESPVAVFVSTDIDSWQKSPKPDWYDESDGFLWRQLTGLFKNTPSDRDDHIENCDGSQAMWLFAVPGVGLFQESVLTGSSDPPLSERLNATFTVGRSYHLTAGVIGMGGGMSNGATLELSLYYRDASSNRVTVAATSVTNSPTQFSNRTRLVEFRVEVPSVKTNDSWANQPLGIGLLSTVGFELQGGYWDLDNLHLTETRSPILHAASSSEDPFSLILESEPGLRCEILTAMDITTPLSEWVRLLDLINTTGRVAIPISKLDSSARFYRVRELTLE